LRHARIDPRERAGDDAARKSPMTLLISWLILSVAVWITAVVLPGFHLKNAKSALLVAAIFGLLNYFLGWLFFAVFAVATLGLAWLFAFVTRWIINAILLKLTDAVTDHLKIDGFGWALAGALVMSAVGTAVQWALVGAR
jgi:putative membrane protein